MRVEWELANKIRITTLRLANTKAGEAPSESVQNISKIQEEGAEISGEIATGGLLGTSLEAVTATTDVLPDG